MLNYFIAGIIAVIIYQVITLIVYLLSGEKEEALVITAILVPFGVFSLVAPLYKIIRLVYYRKNYNFYRFCYTNKDGTKDKTLGSFAAKTKDIEKFSQNENDKYYIELIRQGKDFKSAPYKNQVYKGQEHFMGWDMNKFKKL
jgi:hypothetical protein